MILGNRSYIIEEFRNQNIICDACGESLQNVVVYQEFFHLFFFPLIPTSSKYIKNECIKCKYSCESFNKEYLQSAKAPPFLLIAIAVVVSVIIIGMSIHYMNKKENSFYVRNPQIGDIYLIRDNIKGSIGYYFYKVTSIDPESKIVEMVHNQYIYKSYNGKMSDNDNFVYSERIHFTEEGLIQMVDEGLIDKIERIDKYKIRMIDKLKYLLEIRFN